MHDFSLISIESTFIETVNRLQNVEQERKMSLMNFAIEEELFNCWAYYAGLLLFKMLLMSAITGFLRIGKGIFLNQEDASFLSGQVSNDATIDRVKRAHVNDMENIYVYIFLSYIYMCTNPAVSTAIFTFKVFVWARFAHTIIYVFQVPQPGRITAFIVGQLSCAYMAMHVLSYFNK